MQVAIIVVRGIASIAAPFIVQDPVLMLSPCTQKVHAYAEMHFSGTKAHIFQMLHYFAKPIDRAIQAITAPIFKIIAYFEYLIYAFDEEQWLLGSLGIVCTPIAIPIALIWGLFESALLLGNGCIQLVLPFSTLYDCIKGKEAAREYFDFRDYQRSRIIEDEKQMWIRKNIVRWHKLPKCKKPRKSMQELHKRNRRSSKEASTLYDIGDRCRTKTEQDVAALFLITKPSTYSIKLRQLVHS